MIAKQSCKEYVAFKIYKKVKENLLEWIFIVFLLTLVSSSTEALKIKLKVCVSNVISIKLDEIVDGY